MKSVIGRQLTPFLAFLCEAIHQEQQKQVLFFDTGNNSQLRRPGKSSLSGTEYSVVRTDGIASHRRKRVLPVPGSPPRPAA